MATTDEQISNVTRRTQRNDDAWEKDHASPQEPNIEFFVVIAAIIMFFLVGFGFLLGALFV